MSIHNIIPGRRTPNTGRRTPYVMSLLRAREYSISDVRRCLNAQPDQITPSELRNICKNARLKNLTKNPLRTLRSYKREMDICLRCGNGEAHYIEGVKFYFALNDARRGLQHLDISAANQFDQGKYLLGILKLVSGDHDEGAKILDSFEWKKNTGTVDRLWKNLERSLRDVPIVMRKSYGMNQSLIMPSRACDSRQLKERCTECFHYKEIEKFLQLVYRG